MPELRKTFNVYGKKIIIDTTKWYIIPERKNNGPIDTLNPDLLYLCLLAFEKKDDTPNEQDEILINMMIKNSEEYIELDIEKRKNLLVNSPQYTSVHPINIIETKDVPGYENINVRLIDEGYKIVDYRIKAVERSKNILERIIKTS